MSTPPRTRIEPGLYRNADGSIVVRPRRGSKSTIELTGKEIRFPAGTDVGVARAALLRELEKLQTEINGWKQAERPDRGSFAADVDLYFATANLSAKTRAWRKTAIFPWWVTQFAQRSRHTLEAGEIIRALNTLETVRHGWNKKPADGARVERTYQPAAASTKNHYRTALYHLFTVLNGKNGSNPVRDVPKYDEGTPAARDQAPAVVDAILQHVRDRGQGSRPSLSKARLMVLAYAPVTPKQLYSLAKKDVDFDRAFVVVPGRKKGTGTLPITKPLTPQGLAAFRLFDAAGAWGLVGSAASLQRAFNRAKALAIAELQRTRPDLDLSTVIRMRPYDLRHSFGTTVYAATGNLDAVRELLHHSDAKTTRRYAQGAVSLRLLAANEAITAAFAGRVVPAPAVPRPRLVKRR